MWTNLIVLGIIFIAYSCIQKGKVFKSNGLLGLIVITLAALFVSQTLTAIIGVHNGSVKTETYSEYIPVKYTKAKKLYFGTTKTKIRFDNSQDTSQKIKEITKENCVIHPYSKFNYIARNTKQYLHTKWVCSIALPANRVNYDVYMTPAEFKRISSSDSTLALCEIKK